VLGDYGIHEIWGLGFILNQRFGFMHVAGGRSRQIDRRTMGYYELTRERR
jgi:hypothetical protein